jgi:hypothetical protein
LQIKHGSYEEKTCTEYLLTFTYLGEKTEKLGSLKGSKFPETKSKTKRTLRSEVNLLQEFLLEVYRMDTQSINSPNSEKPKRRHLLTRKSIKFRHQH